jgi:magnesium transporter
MIARRDGVCEKEAVKKNKQPPPPRTRIAIHPRITPGAPPGTLTPVPGSAPAVITVLRMENKRVHAPETLSGLDALPQPEARGAVCYWVRVTGLGDLAPLLAIRDAYGLANMALEDMLSPGWRSKMEVSGDYVFFVLQAPPSPDAGARGEHLCLFYRDNLVISFEESATTLIDALWRNLATAPIPPHIKHTAGYCTYAALDMIIDRFFPLLDQKDEALAKLEDCLALDIPRRAEMEGLHRIKRNLITLRRLLTPYRELGASLRQFSVSHDDELRPYIADLVDHIVQAAELVDGYHELSKSLDDMYQSTITNRTNEIIRILTIISTIFMPLTFIVGVYGMNFDPEISPWNMPELKAYFGYPLILLVMIAVVALMLWFFRKKKWL